MNLREFRDSGNRARRQSISPRFACQLRQEFVDLTIDTAQRTMDTGHRPPDNRPWTLDNRHRTPNTQHRTGDRSPEPIVHLAPQASTRGTAAPGCALCAWRFGSSCPSCRCGDSNTTRLGPPGPPIRLSKNAHRLVPQRRIRLHLRPPRSAASANAERTAPVTGNTALGALRPAPRARRPAPAHYGTWHMVHGPTVAWTRGGMLPCPHAPMHPRARAPVHPCTRAPRLLLRLT